MTYEVQKSDIPKAASVLADAFEHDPLWTKLFKDESDYNGILRTFFEVPLRYCHRYGEILATTPQLEGVAAILPGNRADMTLWRTIASGAILPGMRLGPRLSSSIQTIFDPVQRDRNSHLQGRSYLYLFVIGIGSKFQHQGLGKALVSEVIRKASHDNRPVYLETETEENVTWYEKLGFRTLKQIILKKLDLPLWEMVREPE